MKSNGTHTKKGTVEQDSKKKKVTEPGASRKLAALEVRAENEKLIVSLPRFDTPKRSRSGKSFLIATTGGVKLTQLLVDGSPVYIVANAFFYDNDRQPSPKYIPLFEPTTSEGEQADEEEEY